MNVHYRQIRGRDVWVSTLKPFLKRDDGSYAQVERLWAFFKIDSPPAVIQGQVLKDPKGIPMEFDDETAAADAAFVAAEHLLEKYRGS